MSVDLKSGFEKLIKGQVSYKSDNLGCNLLIYRMKNKYDENKTTEVLETCLKEMTAFFDKYNRVLTKDIEALMKL